MEVRGKKIKKSRGERGGGAGGRKKIIKKRWKRGLQELRGKKKNIFKESAAKRSNPVMSI